MTTTLGSVMETTLSSLFRGRATWTAERDVYSRSTRLGFQCSRRTPTILVTDHVLEDAYHAATHVVGLCLDLYERHHQLVATGSELLPIATCRECRSYVTLDDESRMSPQGLYEHCESQSVRWMERTQLALSSLRELSRR